MNTPFSVTVSNCSRAYSRIKLGAAALIALTLPMAGFAQSAGEVTLHFANGQASLSGTLKDFRNGRYFLESSIGLVAIPEDGAVCEGSACPQAAAPEPENRNVVLEAPDGSLYLSGELITIENNAYVIRTVFGVQRIPTRLVACTGPACPSAAPAQPDDRIIELSNGRTTLRGELLGFDGKIYNLDEETMGNIYVNATGFECEGASCP